MFAASKTGRAVAAGAATDPYFNQTVLLLNDTGTNGAQNNTFIDSSTNNFTITRNGNTTQGSVSPYQPTGYWSMYSPGGGSTLTTTAAGLAVGTGDFTCEGWFFFATIGSVSDEVMVCSRGIATGFQTTRRSTNWTLDLNSSTVLATATGVVTNNNVWYHLAVTRQSGTIRLFTNGVLNTTVTGNTSNFTSTSFCLGALNSNNDYNVIGNISNFRFVASTALYTSTFTPPTTPLTAVSGTVLLLAQDNRFKDNSSNNFTMTVNGSPKVSHFNPLPPTASYSGATYGGSGYFDGTGDYLTAPANAAFNFGSGDFTVECWVNLTLTSTMRVMGQTSASATGTSTSILIDVSTSGVITIYIGFTTTTFLSAVGPSSITANTWNHIVGTRNGNNFYVYVNGVAGTALNLTGVTLFSSSEPWTVGRNGSYTIIPFYVNGYISNVRVVKGTAVYTSNFTPPTAPVTAITNTQLLLNATNAGIYDATALNDMETVGNAQVSTTQYKWGASSMSFDGTGDYIDIPTTISTLGTGNFTIELWVYFNSFSSGPTIIDNRFGAYVSSLVIYDNTGGGTFQVYLNNANRISFTVASTSQWYHMALCKSSGTTKFYLNGTQQGTSYTDANNYSTPKLRIGANLNGDFSLNGYIEDLRITNGVARYTANFTAPTAAFPTR